MEEKSVDIVIATDFFPELYRDYRVVQLYRDKFNVITTKDHPLLEKRVNGKLSIYDIKGYPLLMPDRKAYGPMAAFFQNFVPPEIRSDDTVEYYQDIDSAVARTIDGYVGFSSEHNRDIYSDMIEFTPLSDADTSYPVSAFVSLDQAKSSELTHCADELQDIAKQLAKQASVLSGE